MVARVLFPLAPILEGHDHIPTEGDHKGPHHRPSSTLAPTDVDGLVLRGMPMRADQSAMCAINRHLRVSGFIGQSA